MLIKIKSVKASAKKGKIDVSYKVNGVLTSTTIKECKDVEKAIIAFEEPKKEVKPSKVAEVKEQPSE